MKFDRFDRNMLITIAILAIAVVGIFYIQDNRQGVTVKEPQLVLDSMELQPSPEPDKAKDLKYIIDAGYGGESGSGSLSL